MTAILDMNGPLRRKSFRLIDYMPAIETGKRTIREEIIHRVLTRYIS